MEEHVEAISQGRIIKVSESYAKREGLPIIRKPQIRRTHETPESPPKRIKQEIQRPDFFKRKLNWRDDQVLTELIENFHWHISSERRKKNLSRKQLADLISEPEEYIKMIEHGMLPSKDFIIINKIQKALNVNLRKDRKNFDRSVHEILAETDTQEPSTIIERRPKEEAHSNLSGDEIEILED